MIINMDILWNGICNLFHIFIVIWASYFKCIDVICHIYIENEIHEVM